MNSPVKKNQDITLEIIDLSYEGLGVAKLDHYPIFVDDALPGEKVIAHIVKVGKKFAFAKAIQHLTVSSNRVDLKDRQLTQTGIAPLQHLSYAAQLQFKTQQVIQALKKAGLSQVKVADTIGMNPTVGYRNKAQVPVRRGKDGLDIGFFRKNSHQFIPMDDFYIQDPAIDRALIVVRDILRQFGVSAYDETKHEGVMRHIMIRRGYHSHEMMVVLVTRKKKLFKAQQIAQAIMAALPEVVSVVQNINDQRTNVILGKEETLLAGRPYIEDEMLQHQFYISAPSFYQVNTAQAEAMYQYAIHHTQLNPDTIAIDAYCGIGTITLSVAPFVKHIYGVEIVPEAIHDAKKNARLNHLDNATFVAGKAEEVMKEWQQKGIQADVVFVDPPRKGLASDFTQTLIETQPKQISYISCNPATFARDAALLTQGGYTLSIVQPFDMFPQTTHIELVAIFERNEVL